MIHDHIQSPEFDAMRCPHCGREGPSSGPCSSCSALLPRPANGGMPPPGFDPDAPTRLLTDAGEALPMSRGLAGDSGPLRPGQAFGSRYHIIRLLGIGGMGAVYQAWDAELGVAVAIKVIRPEVMADPAAAGEVERRFKRELLLARQVTHKNVVRIHDLGEIDGIKYITMPYVEGADLATRAASARASCRSRRCCAIAGADRLGPASPRTRPASCIAI